MNLVYDKKLVKEFLTELMKDSTDTDVFYVSTYYRNKYCKNATMRNASSINLDRYLLKYPKKDVEFNVYKLYKRLNGIELFTSKEGEYLNTDGIVAYINVNPSDTFKAATKTIASFQKTIEELYDCGEINEQISRKIKKFDIDYMKSIQNNRSRKNFIDIDIDGDESQVNKSLNIIESSIPLENSGSMKIYTRGGVHILIKTDLLREHKINLKQVLDDANANQEGHKFECKINKIGQVPIVGTIQGGDKEVTMKKY